MFRFQNGGGVTQPSQIRSIKYLEKTFNDFTGINKRIEPQVIKVDCIKMYGIPKMSSNYFRPYIELYTVRTGEMVYTTKDPNGKNKKYKTEEESKGPIEIPFSNCPPQAGDILFRVYHTGN
jgi:C2 domain of PTEN tumour-suppressor protein